MLAPGGALTPAIKQMDNGRSACMKLCVHVVHSRSFCGLLKLAEVIVILLTIDL
mgnify:CR=1 FL=1